jgi:hypothetical protein
MTRVQTVDLLFYLPAKKCSAETEATVLVVRQADLHMKIEFAVDNSHMAYWCGPFGLMVYEN